MTKINRRGFGITRLVTILIVLLCAPLTASATGSLAYSSEHGTVSDRCADHCLDIVVQPGSPAEMPLHCHLKSPQPQQGGLSQAPVTGNDLPLLTLHVASTPAHEAATCVPVTSIRTPIAGPPRFILFGNFRS